MRQRVDYDRYINSPQWRRKRGQLMKQLKPFCRGCFAKGALQLHHISYAHLGHESARDCTPLCGPCHERITVQCRRARHALLFKRSIT